MKRFLALLLCTILGFAPLSSIFAADDGQTETTKPTDGEGDDEEPDCE